MTRLIDADALQRKICDAKCGCEYEDCGNEGDCEFDHFISWAPKVEAEPVRHGKWIEHKWAEESCDGLISNYECSECHSWFREWGHYCSDCGARMDGD